MDMASAIQEELRQVETALAEVNRRKQDLEVAKTVLEKVLASGGSVKGPPIHMPQYTAGQRLSTVDCIKTLLRQHPDGLPMSTLVNTLEGQIVSQATNKRRVLQNTVLQLKRAKAIKKVTRGGHSLVMLNE